MQITRIKVDDLYGLHHYEINFDKEACIKIIHAPNGYGKTTLLKLMDAIMYYKLEEILHIPFRRFEIGFADGLNIQVIKQYNNHFEKLEYIFQEEGDKTCCKCVLDHHKCEREIKDKLQEIRNKMTIHLIKANRLILEDGGKDKVSAVMGYAKELGEKMKEILAKSAKLNELLDYNFPHALLKMHMGHHEVISYEQIQSELRDIEAKRRSLEKIGLLTPIVTHPLELNAQTSNYILRTLAVYIEDTKKKLAVFDDIAPRMQLMQELINKRFIYKKMCLSQEEGFVFEVPYNEKLPADKLSSGEQNELILIFELLFKSHMNAVILIDEPEISLHIAWQQNFLEDMEKIAALTGVKLIIATHSPDIINGRWDLTTGLEEC